MVEIFFTTFMVEFFFTTTKEKMIFVFLFLLQLKGRDKMHG